MIKVLCVNLLNDKNGPCISGNHIHEYFFSWFDYIWMLSWFFLQCNWFVKPQKFASSYIFMFNFSNFRIVHTYIWCRYWFIYGGQWSHNTFCDMSYNSVSYTLTRNKFLKVRNIDDYNASHMLLIWHFFIKLLYFSILQYLIVQRHAYSNTSYSHKPYEI